MPSCRSRLLSGKQTRLPLFEGIDLGLHDRSSDASALRSSLKTARLQYVDQGGPCEVHAGNPFENGVAGGETEVERKGSRGRKTIAPR